LWNETANKPIFNLVHALEEIRNVQTVSIRHIDDNNNHQYSIITHLMKEIIRI